jgi:four helix bundle protein
LLLLAEISGFCGLRERRKVGCWMWGVGCRVLDVGCWMLDFIIKISVEMTRFKFENFIIWQKAMEFGEGIHLLTKRFPVEEKYNLSIQIRKAVDSIALNISEGSIEQSAAEFKRFIGYAARSLAEVVTCLHKSLQRDYISEKEFIEKYDEAYYLMNMIIAFKKTIK